MAILAVDSVTYRYPLTDRPALRNLSFEVQSGEFVAIVGANGSGKSTLCYLLTGFVPHFFQGVLQGRVIVAGLALRTWGFPARKCAHASTGRWPSPASRNWAIAHHLPCPAESSSALPSQQPL